MRGSERQISWWCHAFCFLLSGILPLYFHLSLFQNVMNLILHHLKKNAGIMRN